MLWWLLGKPVGLCGAYEAAEGVEPLVPVLPILGGADGACRRAQESTYNGGRKYSS